MPPGQFSPRGTVRSEGEQEMDDYYDELVGEDDDESGPKEKEEYQSELTSIEYSEHVVPVI